MSMKFKSRVGFDSDDAEVFVPDIRVKPPYSAPEVLTVHNRRTKKGRAVLKLVKAAPLLLDALRDCVALIERDMPGDRTAQPELIAANAAIAAATN